MEEATSPFSDATEIKRNNVSEGDVKFTYKTFLRGPKGLQAPYMNGKIEITDRKEKSSPTQWNPTAWSDGKQFRLAIEIGEEGKEKWHRDQVRFVAHFDNSKADKYYWDDQVQFIKDFNRTGGISSEDFHNYIFLVCALEEFNGALDTTSGNSGYKIISSSFDMAQRKMSLEFERPLDVFTDVSYLLEPGKPYKIWIQWGVFNNEDDQIQWKVKGMRARLVDSEFYDFGKKFILKSPPGWDQVVKEERKLRDIEDHATSITVSVVIALFVAAINLY